MHSDIGVISLIEEVDHDHVMLLAVTVTATNSLFDALRIPRQVVVHDQRAELQVDALGCGFRRQHDGCFVSEMLNQRCPRINDS